MEDNIFAKIGRGDITVETIYEDEHVVAFRDVNPQAPVHALVIPKKPIENVLDGLFRDHERVNRRLRVHVPKRDDVLVLVDRLDRYVAAPDFGKDVVFHEVIFTPLPSFEVFP